MTGTEGQARKTTLKEFLQNLVEHWDVIPIRVKQRDENGEYRWQSRYLAEITDSQDIVNWINDSKGRFYN